MNSDLKVLCQDCGKIMPYTMARHNGDEHCECGGDFCGCHSCMDIIDSRKGN